MSLETIVAVSIGLTASGEDLWRRNISNWIPLAALAGALCVQLLANGWWGLAYWAGGAIAGFLAFLLFYILGGMGGGDVKLMAWFGALLGPSRLLEAVLWTAAIGGLMAAGVILWREAKRFWRRKFLADKFQGESLAAATPTEDAYIPYAPAITLGSWLALIPKGA